MIKLKDILMENYQLPERRVGTGRIDTLMEKLIPTLTTEQQKSITELYNYEQFEACFKEEVDSVARTLITKLNEIIKTGNDNPNTHLAEMTVTAIGESCLLN